MTQEQYENLLPFKKQLELSLCCYIRLNNIEFLEAINKHLGYIMNWNDYQLVKKTIEAIANDFKKYEDGNK